MGSGGAICHTSSQKLDVADRRAFVIGLRRAAATYRQIAAAAVDRFGEDALPSGWGPRYAYRDVKAEMNRMRKHMQNEIMEMRIMQTERLEEILRVNWPKVLEGHAGATDRALKALKEENSLWGLYPPKQVDMRVGDLDDSIERELAELATLRQEAIPRAIAAAKGGAEAPELEEPAGSS